MTDHEIVSKVRLFLRQEGIIIPKGPVREFYSQLIKVSGLGIGGLLTLSGKKAGRLAGTYLKELIGKDRSSIEEIKPYISVFLDSAGICKIEGWDTVDEKKIIVKAKDSIFAEGISGKKPVCMPLSGAFTGLLEEVMGVNFECKELECQAQGMEFCVFEIKLK